MTHLCPHGRALVSCVPCRQYYTEQWGKEEKMSVAVFNPQDKGGPGLYGVGPSIPFPSTPFSAVLTEMQAMHDRKNADYGRTGDPLSNVRASTDFGVPAWVGALIRANDKMRRIQKFAADGALANESVEDSLIDLAVYAVIGLILYRETKT